MQPETIMKPFFPITKHLINPFTIPEELKSRRVANALSSLWAFINIEIYKCQFWKFIAVLTENRKDLAANTAPRCAVVNDCRGFGDSDAVKGVLEILIRRNGLEVAVATGKGEAESRILTFSCFCVAHPALHLSPLCSLVGFEKEGNYIVYLLGDTKEHCITYKGTRVGAAICIYRRFLDAGFGEQYSAGE
ncbi:hypothetical protein ACLOJK_034590 [Asimina triloba]